MNLPPWARAGLAGVAMASVMSAAAPIAAFGAESWDGPLRDESHRLSTRHRADIVRRLSAVERRLGSPVFILITDKVPRGNVADLAARTFAAQRFGRDPQSNPVLLVWAVRDHVAAIETGKGNAGIVPEIDARRIVREVTRSESGNLPDAVVQAIDAIVASAEDTIARRKPLPPEEDPSPKDAMGRARGEAGADADAYAQADAAVPPVGPTPSSDPTSAPSSDPTSAPASTPLRKSRVPWAAAVAVLVLVGVALRGRRKANQERKPPPPASRLGGPPWR